MFLLMLAQSSYVRERKEEGGGGEGIGGEGEAAMTISLGAPPQELSMVLKICAHGDSRILPQGDHGRDT